MVLLDKYEFGDDMDELDFVFGAKMVQGNIDTLIKNLNNKRFTIKDVDGWIELSLNKGDD